jgi:metal-dependent amidase/aminoacylase/carboxypeptidase family protein
MVHATSNPDDRLASVNASSNGMVAKRMQFLGRASHAGGAPWDGINALNAGHVALAALHAQRETFRDEDSIRVHPIITKGGSLVNVVPDDVRMETFVRGKNMKAVTDAASKVDRASRAGAVAVGGQLRIETLHGCLPLRNDPTLTALFKNNMLSFISPDQFVEGLHSSASTDMGDITHIMPGLHPHIGGATGTLHGMDFTLTDSVHLCLDAAKSLAMTVVDLLAEEAAVGRQLLASFRPAMSRAEYLRFARSLSCTEQFDGASAGLKH